MSKSDRRLSPLHLKAEEVTTHGWPLLSEYGRGATSAILNTLVDARLDPPFPDTDKGETDEEYQARLRDARLEVAAALDEREEAFLALTPEDAAMQREQIERLGQAAAYQAELEAHEATRRLYGGDEPPSPAYERFRTIRY